MTDYALVRNGSIESFGLPPSARRLDDGAWVLGLPAADDAIKAACGYLPIALTARPADTPTETHDQSIGLVAGTPAVMWTKRPKTEAELNPPKSAEDKVAAAAAVLANVDALSAPVTSVDVVEILLDLKTALGG